MTSAEWVRVDLDAVEKYGADAAVVLGFIAYRCAPTGEWEATMQDLVVETRLTDHRVRAAVKVLRETGEVHSYRADRFKARLTWGVFPGQSENGISPVSGRGFSPDHETGIFPVSTSLQEVKETSGVPEGPVRPEVVALCERLADRIEANGSKRPTITAGWLTACRLLIDKDQREPEKVARAIDWCQADEFWRANILSMPTLRKQYDRLRLAAQRESGGRPRPVVASPDEAYDPSYAAALPPPPKRDLYA